MLKFLALHLIKSYQKYLSPYKGFNCAYRVVNGAPAQGCSAYGHKVIARYGVFKGIELLRRRFYDCAWYNEKRKAELKQNNPEGTYLGTLKLAKNRHYQRGSVDCGGDCVDCNHCDCGSSHGSGSHCGFSDLLDYLPCDCGSGSEKKEARFAAKRDRKNAGKYDQLKKNQHSEPQNMADNGDNND